MDTSSSRSGRQVLNSEMSQLPCRNPTKLDEDVICVEDSSVKGDHTTSTIDLTQCSNETVVDTSNREQDSISRHSVQSVELAVKRETEPIFSAQNTLSGINVFASNIRARKDAKSGLYKDGKYEAASLKIHLNPMSIPVLDTPDDGMLHIVTGWGASDILSDLCYRYVTQGMWESKKCGFLEEPQLMRKRGYRCNGVMVCPIMLSKNIHFNHANEEEWGKRQASISSVQDAADILEMRKARNLFVTMTNPDIHFCPAKVLQNKTVDASSNPGVLSCVGGPALRQVHATKEWFIGCTHYYLNRNVQPRHYFHSLRNYTDKAIGYLRGMITDKKPLVIPGDVCEYVAGKKGRGVKRCGTHGLHLVEYGTANSAIGKCKSKMILMEPIAECIDHSDREEHQPVTFAICIGSHNHPPPPQADTTQRKTALFRSFAQTAPTTTAAVLKLQAQATLHSGQRSALQNLNMNNNNMYSTLQEIRRKTQKDEFTSMFEMVSASHEPYVRDVRVVTEGVVFLLGTTKMLQHATRGMVISGDATFKTVIESNPHEITPSWYLYNFVVPEDITSATHKGVVVARALMTSLKTEAYTALWSMFLGQVKSEYAKILGVRSNDVSIDVPYMPLEPERKRNAISIRSVTTDFEVAEVEGVAAAFAEIRGGSADMHVLHLLIGCRVHFERAVLKRAASLREPERTRFKQACRMLRAASTVGEADEQYAVIHGIDENWGAWLSRSHIRPLVSPPYSKMTKCDRMIALDNTNIVESQNRRGNLICGTAMHPVTCTRKLQELDSITSEIIRMGDGTRGQQVPRARKRNSNTLTPSNANSKKGGTILERKRKTSGKGNARNIRQKLYSAGETVTNNRMGSGSNSPSSTQPATPNNGYDSMSWLHGHLGERCRAALTDGNEKLLVALSELYTTVLESNNSNTIKQRILSTIVKQGIRKDIIAEFTEILFLLSQQTSAVPCTQAQCSKEGITTVLGQSSADSNPATQDNGSINLIPPRNAGSVASKAIDKHGCSNKGSSDGRGEVVSLDKIESITAFLCNELARSEQNKDVTIIFNKLFDLRCNVAKYSVGRTHHI